MPSQVVIVAEKVALIHLVRGWQTLHIIALWRHYSNEEYEEIIVMRHMLCSYNILYGVLRTT